MPREAMTPIGILAIDVEAKIANFFAGLPFEQDAAFGERRGTEGNELNGSGSGDRRRKRRSVVDEIRIAGGGGNRGRIGRQSGGAEGAGGNVDGNDSEVADTERAEATTDGGGCSRVSASALCSGHGSEGDLSRKRVANRYILRDGRAVIGDLQAIGEVGALVDGVGGSILRYGDVGLRWRSNDNRRGSGVIGAIRIGDRRSRNIDIGCVGDRGSRNNTGVDLND